MELKPGEAQVNHLRLGAFLEPNMIQDLFEITQRQTTRLPCCSGHKDAHMQGNGTGFGTCGYVAAVVGVSRAPVRHDRRLWGTLCAVPGKMG